MMLECQECYSKKSRVTPLLGARECLEKHIQYVCGTCGRCICIDKDEKRNVQRWNFPFKSLEIAKLYLRTADISSKKNCGIYEIINEKGRKSYKIFAETKELDSYLAKHKGKVCEVRQPVFQQTSFREMPHAQIKKLSQEEVEVYLQEQVKESAI